MKQLHKNRTVTIKDIADKLNISPSSVSRALNNNSRISKKTIDLVWETAKELGYRPNVPSLFKAQPSHNIGVIVPEIKSHFYSDAVLSIQESARKHGYNVILSVSDNSNKIEADIVKNFINLNLDGILISFSSISSNLKLVKEVISSKITLVNFGNINFDLPVPKATIDIYQGVAKALEHLVSVKRTRTALLVGNTNSYYDTEILNSYKSALKILNIKFDESLIIQSDLTNDDIEASIKILLNLKNIPDSILICNNYVALNAISCLKMMKIEIPRDISVVSLGSESFNDFLSQSITSVKFSGYNLGKSAFKLMLKALNDKSKSIISDTVIQPVKLLIKGTSLEH